MTIFTLENIKMTNIYLVSSQRFLKFVLLAYSIANLIQCNSVWKEVQTSILTKKTHKNVHKLSLNMSPQVDIP